MQVKFVNKNGRAQKIPVFVMTEGEFSGMNEDGAGLCLACGAEASGVEPDAVGYKCEECRAPKVYGIENALLMGRVQFKGDDNE
jgi:hypothetical protein